MSNARASGKQKQIEKQKKVLETAAGKAKPTAAPQDTDEPTKEPQPTQNPTSQETPDTATGSDTPDEGSQKPVLEVDYRNQYHELSGAHKKLQAAHETLKGKFNKQNEEIKHLKAQAESTPAQTAPAADSPVMERLRNSEQYKNLQDDWNDEIAEHFAGLAALAATPPQTQAPAPSTQNEPDNSSPMEDHEDPFFLALDNRLPGWDYKYNNNQEFIQWADGNVEPFSNETYQSLLEKAAHDGDVDAAARIFSAFDRSRVRQNNDNLPNPEEHVFPDTKGSGGGPDPQPREPEYSEGYLHEQEALLRRGKIDRDEFYKRRNEFMRAAQDGRVKRAA